MKSKHNFRITLSQTNNKNNFWRYCMWNKLTSPNSNSLYLKRTPLLVIHNSTTISPLTKRNIKYKNNKHHIFVSFNGLSPSLSICTLVTVPRDIEQNTIRSCQCFHLLVNDQMTLRPNTITGPSIEHCTNLHAHFSAILQSPLTTLKPTSKTRTIIRVSWLSV